MYRGHESPLSISWVSHRVAENYACYRSVSILVPPGASNEPDRINMRGNGCLVRLVRYEHSRGWPGGLERGSVMADREQRPDRREHHAISAGCCRAAIRRSRQ